MTRLGLTPQDGMAAIGLFLVTVGAGLAWLPLGFLVPGFLILAYAILPDQQPAEPVEPRIEP